MATLKPFAINLNDLLYLLEQVNFVPLFDGAVNSNGIVNFDPLTMDAWDAKGNQVWTAPQYDINNVLIPGTGTGSYKGVALDLGNVDLLGSGFPHVSSSIGIRDVSGLHNNLFGSQADWGAVDVPFRRDVAANFDNYVTAQGTVKVAINPDSLDLTIDYFDPLMTDVTIAVGDYAPVGFSSADLARVTLNASATAVTFTYDNGTANPPAPVTVVLSGVVAYAAAMAGQTVTPNYGTDVGVNGVVFQASVIDLMPRIITRTITTGGVNLLIDTNPLSEGFNHFVAWDHVRFENAPTAISGTSTSSEIADYYYRKSIVDAGVDLSQNLDGTYVTLVDGVKIVAPGGMSLAWDATADSASIMYRTLLTYIAAGGVDDRLYGLDDPSNTDPAVRLPLTDGGPIFIMSTAPNPAFGEPPGFTNLAGLTFDANLFLYHSLVVESGVVTAGLANGDTISLTEQNVTDAIADLASTLGTVATSTAAALLDTGSGYGQLETLGHIDFQNPTSGEYFIGSENPGVAPVNSWFGIFGQFFDHGLDLIGKGGQGTSIKISFAQDDPLFGAQGPNGPAFSISVGRATVAGQDANGDPNYVNHTSPFIDQSQTYGSVDQITNLLREWVSTDGGVTYHAGLELFDGQSLVDAWMRKVPVFDPLTGLTNIVETPVHDTLPTLSELRQHVLDTDRVALTWDDVVDYRNRSAEGTSLSGGTSGHALILDMNPRFDKAHLSPDDGDLLTAWDATVAASVEAAVTTLSAAGATGSPDLAFTAVRDNTNAIVNIQLVVTNNAGGPFLPNGTYTGASALAAWVDFSTFGIMTAPPGVDPLMLDSVRAAVGDLLMASVGDHYIAGDGRVNENFGLTSIHHVFHEEHNFQVENLKSWIYAHDENNPGSLDAHEQLHNWQVDTGNGTDVNGNYIYANGEIAWDADKMFEATKLVVEMEYQHAAVDQYARTVTPRIQEFVGYSTGVDPTVSLEYAQVAFRFGHSTIRETIDAIDPDGWMLGNVTRYALEKAFLNPQQFAETGVAAITLGLSRQQMNEVDEFVTPALNQGLLGQPLDLPAINIARGRDLGIPTLNDFRAAISLAEYTSWADYGVNMVHPESLVNFIAAYSFSDPSGVTPIEVSQAKAQYIIDLANGAPAGTNPFGTTVITQEQAQAFLTNNTVVGNDDLNAARMGFDQIDAWIGGMAEAHVPGGILGETFDAVFVAQIQSLMDGDRFYYLYRLFGTQIHEEVNNGQFKDIVERNTGLTHLNGSIFAYADKYYDFNRNADGLMPDGSLLSLTDNLDEHLYAASLAANPGVGIYSDGGYSTDVNGSPISVLLTDYVRLPETLAFIQDVRPDLNPAQVHAEGTPTSGADSHEVIVATENRDYIHARAGDDTVYGEGGDDFLFGDGGIDRLYGGDGNDLIDAGEGPDLADGGAGKDIIYGRGSGSEVGGFDQLVGGSGNDLVIGGEGIDKLSGGSGDDIIYGDSLTNPEMGNTDAFTHAGDGNDYIDTGASGDLLYGEEGDDYMVGGIDQDLIQGGYGDDILRPGSPSQAINGGPDEVIGDNGGNQNIGFDLMDLSDYASGGVGVVADLATQTNPLVAIDGQTPFPAWFQMEGVIGTSSGDTLTGDSAGDATAVFSQGGNWLIGGSGNDTIRGNGGNDVIIGGSIRLDDVIGRYSDAGTAQVVTLGSSEWLAAAMDTSTGGSGYDDNTENAYTGASNRTADAATTSPVGGLLEAAGMGDQKHFTEMLRSRMFKDVVLGDGGADGSADVAVFRGNRADYAVTEVPFTDASGAIVTAYKITDLRAADVVDAAGILVHDGTDIVVGVEKLQFADMALLSGQFLNTAPTGAALLSGFATASQMVGTVLAEQTNPPIGPMVVETSSIVDGQGTGALGIQWQSLAAGATVWTNIAGATGATYDPMAADIGSQLRAVVSYTDGGGVNERVISAASDVVGNTILGTLNNVANVLAGTAGQDIMFGRGGNDTLNGAAGNDWLDGGTGNDTMNGGLGNDTYVVNATGDVTNEGGNEGIDTVRSAVARTLGNNLENLTLTGTGTIIGTGNALDNVIIGGSGNNTLTGAAGNDTVSGGLGNDTFVATVIVGGTDGDDTYDGGDGVDTLNLSATSASPTNVNLSGAARTVAGQAIAAGTATSSQIGTDTLISIENVNGSSGNNVIVASDAANTINGAGGNDVIAATVDNVRDTFNGGTGTDTADYSAYTTGLTVSLNGTATVTGSGDTDANSDRISAFENFTGGSGQDTITGSSVDNVLDGGDGIDTYSMAATTAAANVNLATGTATSAQIGTDTLISIENINGGTAGDIIVASTAANIINGNGGQDVVVATVDDVRDTFNGGTGIDTADYSGYAVDLAVTLNLNTAVFVSGSGSEFANLDRIAGFENFTGGSGADLITGDNAANALSGGDGNDLLSGGLGADVLTGGAGNDTFVFNAAADSGLTTTTRDTIVGFEGGGAADGDLIDLSGFGLTFSFVGTGIFTAGAANQIRYALDGTGNNTIIQISVDTDTVVEASILLQGYTGLLNVNDFTL